MLVVVDIVVIVVDGVSRPRFRFRSRVEEASVTASSMSKFASDSADESEEPLSLRASSFTSRGLACAETSFAVNELIDAANERV